LGNRLRNISVLRPEWLYDCEEKGRAVPMLRRHLFFAGIDLQTSLSKSFDVYGDSWVSPADAESLVHCFRTMDDMASQGDLDVRGAVADKDEFEFAVTRSMRKAGSVFWGVRVVLPNAACNPNAMDLRPLLECFGATVIDAAAGNAWTNAHPETCGEFLGQLYKLVEAKKSTQGSRCCDLDDNSVLVNEQGRSVGPIIVSDDWVHACIREKKLLVAFV
jgi:hypothetical protein